MLFLTIGGFVLVSMVFKKTGILSLLMSLEMLSFYFFMGCYSCVVYLHHISFIFMIVPLVVLVVGSIMGLSSYVGNYEYWGKDYVLVWGLTKF